MHEDSARALMHIERFVRERLRPAVYSDRCALALAAWDVTGEPVSFAEAVRERFQPIEPTSSWGRPWGTTWFHVTGRVPSGWPANAKIELVADLGFTDALPGFQCEGLVYSADGGILKGIEPRNQYVRLPAAAAGAIDLYIEAASNPDIVSGFAFRPSRLGDRATAGSDPLYRLGRIDLAILDEQVWELSQDMWTLSGLLAELPVALPRSAQIRQALIRCVESIDPQDVSGTAAVGREQLREVLAQPGPASAHRVHAVGHAHIDSAWLWPVRESVRKVARTFANVLALLEEYPDFVFAASSAQQYAWLKQ